MLEVWGLTCSTRPARLPLGSVGGGGVNLFTLQKLDMRITGVGGDFCVCNMLGNRGREPARLPLGSVGGGGVNLITLQKLDMRNTGVGEDFCVCSMLGNRGREPT